MKLARLLVMVCIMAVVFGCGNKSTTAISSPELVAAVKRGDVITAEKLLSEGANPNSTTTDGRESVINIAITRTDVPMTELLLSKKASAEALDKSPFSPLNWAMSSGANTGRKILIIRALVKAGADINKKDSIGRTPLVQLINSNLYNIPVIEEVIRLGGDPSIKNDKGATAIDLAVENNIPESTIEYMKNYKENKGKPTPRFGNTEGQCQVLAINEDKNPEGLQGLYFNHKAGCDDKNLAQGVNGIFTKYNGTECQGMWKDGVLKRTECKTGY